MEMASLWVFWGALALLVYIYVGYPLLLLLLARIRETAHTPDDHYCPPVAMLIAARNERASLPQKIQSIRELDYPKDKLRVWIASDASDDGTDEYLAAQPDVEWIRTERQGGKNAALNLLLERAEGEVLFFTDANILFHPGALRGAARHFADPKTGAVAGELIFTQGGEWNAVGRGTGLYWKYENLIKRAESRLGSVLVVSGAIFAVRRELVKPLTPSIANDLEIPLRVGAQGYSILYEPRCLGYENPHKNAWEEFRRTSRIVSRGLHGFMRLLPVLLANPGRLWQFLSHKFLRWFTLPLALAAWGASFFLLDSWPAALARGAGAAGLAGAALGLALMNRKTVPAVLRPLSILAHLLVMHSAAVWGLGLALAGKTPAAWSPPESSRHSVKL